MANALAHAPNLDVKLVSRSELWVLQLEKLVVNSIINPLTAVLRCKNGVLFESETGIYADIMDALLQETSTVLRALVYDSRNAEIVGSWLGGTNTSPRGETETISSKRAKLAERFSPSSLRMMLYGVGYKVTENRSSMLQDVEAGKPTEVRDFNGWIVDTAASLRPNIGVPRHQKLIALVEMGVILDGSGLWEQLLQ